MLRRLRRGRERVATPDGLADFLATRAAFVSQRSTLDYCRARAGVSWPQLFRESEFGVVLERCRWEAYAAVLGDVAEVALIYLRRHGGDGAALADGVARATRGALERHPVPAHRTGWEDVHAAHTAKLRRVLLAPPRPVRSVGGTSAKRVFEVLPIHTNLKAHDREMVTNNIRFLLCGVYAEMEKALDGPALARCLSVPLDGAAGDAPVAPPAPP